MQYAQAVRSGSTLRQYIAVGSILSNHYDYDTSIEPLLFPNVTMMLILMEDGNYSYDATICNLYQNCPHWVQCTADEFMESYNHMMNTPIK